METQSFTYVSRNTGKEELVNLNENQLNALREFYVERFVDNMETKDLVQYVTDDMFQYMESLPDNEVIDECLNYWDDSFDDVIEVKGEKVKVNKDGDKLHRLIDDLGWEYQRMGLAGRETYDEICHLLNMIQEDEVYMEI